MRLQFSESFNHSCGNSVNKQYSETELKQILLDLMDKNGIDTNKVHTDQEGVISVVGSPNLNLHTIMLKAEKMGLKTKYTKMTQIELCC